MDLLIKNPASEAASAMALMILETAEAFRKFIRITETKEKTSNTPVPGPINPL